MNDNNNVVDFTGVTTLPIDPDKILDAAKGNLKECVVVGWDNNGDIYIGMSNSNIAETVLLLEAMKKELIEIALND